MTKHLSINHSDGHLTPVDRVRESWAYGFDVISITDHRNFTAYEAALATAEELGIEWINVLVSSKASLTTSHMRAE